MKGGRLVQGLITLLVLIGLQFSPVLAQVTDQQRLAELQRRRDDLANEIKKASSGSAAEKTKITKFNTEIKILTSDIQKTEGQILQEQRRIKTKEVQVSEKNDQIGIREAELTKLEDDQDGAIGELYMRAVQDPLMLVYSDSVSAAITEAATLESLQTRIEIDIDTTERLKEELETQRKLLQDEKVQLEKLKRQHEERKSGLSQQKNFKNNLLSNSEATKQEFDDQLKKARDEYNRVGSELFNITARARAGAAQGPPRRVGSVEFQRPVPGIITTRFGEPTYVQAFHTGEDEDCVRNEPVVAASNAKITFVGGDPKYGYGNYIDAEVTDLPGYTWRVGHLTGFAVSVGDQVKRGDLIGFCGNTGFAYAFHPLGDGTHVHAEIRLSGVPIDPALCCFP
ncbi:MAG: peptidoglycan DD-metalloendopeptidase family protein [Patescibacteria group bacterium]